MMNTVHKHTAPWPSTPMAETPGKGMQIGLMLAVGITLVLWASPPIALVAGILFAVVIGHPLAHWSHKATKVLLQVCVVLLGFGMDLPVVLRLGVNGAFFAAASIGATLALGWWLGRRFQLDRRTSALISAGTAVCGGSAIAAVSSVIGAAESEIAVSIGTVFLLNAAALYIFPAVGHWLHLTQGQFGLWAGVAIHDISSVVGAGLSYGNGALNTATAVKLARTLWIVPLTLVLAWNVARMRRLEVGPVKTKHSRVKATVPWFIGFFLLASLARSYVPEVQAWSPAASAIAHRGMILVLFLIGTSLSIRALRSVGWKTVIMGLLLWAFISISSLVAILFLKLGA